MPAFYGYDDCVELDNGTAHVIITPHGGCRVLSYSLAGGANAIHLDDGASGKWESGDDAAGEKPQGWTWSEGQASTGDPFGPSGGRFDVGPEFQAEGPDSAHPEPLTPLPPTPLTDPAEPGGPCVRAVRQGNHPALFFGSWTVEPGASSSRVSLTSPLCASTGLQLRRSFELLEGSELVITSTMTNGGQAPSLRVNHWGRTFVPGGGIALVPLPKDGYSRFPKKYVVYDFGESEAEMAIHFQPSDENITLRDGFVEVGSHRREGREKIGFDSTAGWMGYLSCAPSNPQPAAACTCLCCGSGSASLSASRTWDVG